MGEKSRIAIAVPSEWSMKYQLKGGGLNDLQEFLESTFPQFEFITGGVTDKSREGVLELFQVLSTGADLAERLPDSVMDEVLMAVINFYEPTNKPTH